jgi:UDPglucose--hexose-1-phosphate uridylyltransferase
MKEINISLEIDRLLQYALKHKIIEKEDIIPSRNSLLDLLNVDEYLPIDIPNEKVKTPHEILENILTYAIDKGLLPDNTVTHRDLFDTKIMGALMPRQSEVVRNFFNNYKNRGVEYATTEYYELSKASNYIRMDRVSQNLCWNIETDYGSLDITVNLSKPEKDPKEIAASKMMPESSYPKCLLCIENLGYAGTINHPARQNHRVIPIYLNDEQWYLQYSPYVYYNEHCIVFYENHVPMEISNKTFNRLFSFVDQFPHYFMGSNADLPIVGGSILSHEHFQGGRHTFPMEKAPVEYHFPSKDRDIKIGIVKWPMSVIRVSSKNVDKIIEYSSKILSAWRQHSHEELNIVAFTEENGIIMNHNTITPIARKNKDGEFEMDLVLRNNRVTDKYQDGIFHPHKELHHIKKENIGLIEVMGLAVLPARLNTELKEIQKILEGKINLTEEMKKDKNHCLYKHLPWIEELINKYGTRCNNEESSEIIKNEVGYKFLNVLMDAGVYKRNEEGLKGLIKFVNTVNFEDI